MKKLFSALGVLALCLVASHIGSAAEDRSVKIKAEMVENYLLWQEAFKIRDAERMISFESPDYTSLTQDKRIIPKNESDEMWRAVMESIDEVYSARAEIKRLSIEPKRVVVVTIQRVDSLRRWHDEKLHRVSISGYVRDTWVNYDGVWMLKRSEDLSSKIIVDGQPES